jgi:hypothetical protein
LRYTDPTGHRACEDYGGTCLSEKQVTKKYKAELQNPKNKNKDKSDGGGGHPLQSIIPDHTVHTPLGISNSSYCGGGSNSAYNFFDCGANITQDLALAIDTPFAALDAVLITAGCFAGPEGCLAGAVAADLVFNLTGANISEMVLSIASAGFSIGADATDDGRLGESSAVSVVAAGAGALSPDPILDFTIDGFGAGYNHDIRPISNIVPFMRSLFKH